MNLHESAERLFIILLTSLGLESLSEEEITMFLNLEKKEKRNDGIIQ